MPFDVHLLRIHSLPALPTLPTLPTRPPAPIACLSALQISHLHLAGQNRPTFSSASSAATVQHPTRRPSSAVACQPGLPLVCQPGGVRISHELVFPLKHGSLVPTTSLVPTRSLAPGSQSSTMQASPECCSESRRLREDRCQGPTRTPARPGPPQALAPPARWTPLLSVLGLVRSITRQASDHPAILSKLQA